jgi:DNA-binding response OmpR family regulator
LRIPAATCRESTLLARVRSALDDANCRSAFSERETWKSVALIALSGYGQPEDTKHSHEAGIDHHLVKPADPAALLSLLDFLKPSRPRRALRAVR